MNEKYVSELARIREEGLERKLRAWPHTGARIRVDGREHLNFSSNDYLDLANDARVKLAAKEAIETHGCGATASRLMTGHLSLHRELETNLARLALQESALLFPSGYQTNLALLSTLAGKGDTICSDQLNHASIIDGARLSRAEVRVYQHTDSQHLKQLLEEDKTTGQKFIVSDAVFSMDGDAAPVKELREIADAYNAILVIDEAHAIGIYGNGGGWCVQNDVLPDVTIGTLSKSLGAGGGVIACNEVIRKYLINRARPFIFSTGLSPMNAAAGLAAARIIEEEQDLGARLLRLARDFRQQLRNAGVPVDEVDAPIIPIVVGENRTALDLAEALLAEDIIATAIRPPTVPEGTARLRLTVTLGHTDADLARATEVIARHCLAAASV